VPCQLIDCTEYTLVPVLVSVVEKPPDKFEPGKYERPLVTAPASHFSAVRRPRASNGPVGGFTPAGPAPAIQYALGAPAAVIGWKTPAES
jgi:hypothetical protein